ncbi:MAG: hypothetical protein AAB268_09495 [Elusimicrobiota bacterium]
MTCSRSNASPDITQEGRPLDGPAFLVSCSCAQALRKRDGKVKTINRNILRVVRRTVIDTSCVKRNH